MNILLLSQEYPPETAMGGVGTYMHSIAHAYTGMGHTVHVVSSAAPAQGSYSYMQDAVHVHRIRRWKFEVPLLRRIWFRYFPWTKHQIEYALGMRGALARIVREQEIEIIETTELWAEGIFYSFTRQAPIVVKLHTPLFVLRSLNDMQSTLDWRIVDWVDKMWTRRADQIVSASAALARIVAGAFHLDAEKIPVIPVPVDTTRFQALPMSQNAAPVILFVGQLEPRKGVFTIADAMPYVVAEFPDARLLFVGGDRVIDGRSTQALLLERLSASGVAHHVEFIGRVSNENLKDYLQRASVCLFPSHWENFAISCLEAMASARPVIASNVGGFTEMIEHNKSGLLVPSNNAGELAAAIQCILQRPLWAQELASAARRRVEQNYSIEIVARRNLDLYCDTIAKWRDARRSNASTRETKGLS